MRLDSCQLITNELTYERSGGAECLGIPKRIRVPHLTGRTSKSSGRGDRVPLRLSALSVSSSSLSSLWMSTMLCYSLLFFTLFVSTFAIFPNPYSNSDQASAAPAGPDRDAVLRALGEAVAGNQEQSLWLFGYHDFMYVPLVEEMGSVTVVSTTLDLEAVRELLRGTPVSYMDGNGVYRFPRSWYDPARPWEAFRAWPRSVQEADRALGEEFARDGAPRWMVSETERSDSDNAPYVFLPPAAIQSLTTRINRYSHIVHALASYFRLTHRFQFDTFTPTLSLIGIPRPLDVQNYAIQEIWRRIWDWQGVIRWMLMSSEGNWSRLPLSELRLPHDWLTWLRNDHVFEAGNLGTVLRFQRDAATPSISWHLRRNAPIDWIWNEETRQLSFLRHLSPDMVLAQIQTPFESHTIPGSSQELEAPSIPDEQPPITASPPLRPELPRNRTRRWTEGIDKKKDYWGYWLFSRKDDTKKGTGYRYGKPFGWKKRILAQELEFAPNFPRRGQASWILDEWDGISEPNTPIEQSFSDDPDFDMIPPLNLTSDGIPTGGGPAPPSPPSNPVPLPVAELDPVIDSSRDSDEELLDYGEFTDEEVDSATVPFAGSRSEAPAVPSELDIASGRVDEEILEEIEADQLRMALEASRQSTSEAPSMEVEEGVASTSRVRLPSGPGRSRSPPREPRAFRDRRRMDDEERTYQGKGKQRASNRGSYASRGPRGPFRSRGYRPYRAPIQESSFTNPPEGFVQGARTVHRLPPSIVHQDSLPPIPPPPSRPHQEPFRIYLPPESAHPRTNFSATMPSWGTSETTIDGWMNMVENQSNSGWGGNSTWGSVPEINSSSEERVSREEEDRVLEEQTRRLDLHPEGNRIDEAAEWHPPVASLRERLGIESQNVSLRQRIKDGHLLGGRTLEDRLEDSIQEPDRVLSLPEAVQEEFAQPRSNSEYWPWTGSLARLEEIRNVIRVRTTAEIILERGEPPRALIVPHRVTPLREGFLYLSALTAIRAADWRHRHGPNSWEEFLLHAIGTGIPFEWRVPTADLIPVADAPVPPSWVHTDPVTEWWNHEPGNIMASYLWAVQEVLSRPNAIRALHSGGLLWRIAVEYGSMTLMEAAVRGPSDIATVYRRGRTYPLPVPSTTDHLSEQEVNALVGMTDNGTSVWPSLTVFEGPGSIMWDGEWSLETERWFRRRLNALQGERDVLLRENLWYRDIIRSARTPRREPSGTGSAVWAADIARDVPHLGRLYRIPMDPIVETSVEADAPVVDEDPEEEEADDQDDTAT
ncbi:uncharacterized protein STEHIDRAFT_158858 [Stereum hirsutum FP-91666 SS1]|uniref:uncharacterized protein n=1 Tax=Stereum hirsutum (strain FP-91666) TaxID=721885 RepID=UPI0004449B5E|nr:uncharacterized protein STEHIDRAFT_158858 [Stereum hirsutum FP-91666 SS1]EIM85170.1 hypothetical protein STEHIDRAFT_158858 [Stereum hirsutum FP-91666 SS1]